MIVDWIIHAFMTFIGWILSQAPHLPSWPGAALASAVTTVVAALSPGMTAMDYYVPVQLWLVLCGVILTAELSYTVWSGVRWVINHVPFIGGGS